jgi:hypothetical protein
MALMPPFSHWLFGSAPHGKSWRCRSRRHNSLSSDTWLRSLRRDLFPKSELGKNCRYGGTIEVALPELLGERNCGAGIMLLLAITTRRVHAQLSSNLH